MVVQEVDYYTGHMSFEIVLKDITYALAKFGATVDAWCTNNGPNGKKYDNCLEINTHG